MFVLSLSLYRFGDGAQYVRCDMLRHDVGCNGKVLLYPRSCWDPCDAPGCKGKVAAGCKRCTCPRDNQKGKSPPRRKSSAAFEAAVAAGGVVLMRTVGE